MHRLWIALGSLAGLTAVAAAAASAHLLEGAAPGAARAAASGVQMQGWHALALVACGLWAERRPGILPQCAGAAFALGTLSFCMATYAFAFGGLSLGPLAPIGGTLLMLGWLLLGASAARR